ncbi:MAG: hypothetical protein EBV83_01015 [Verrucomicrobia bacterium]|nr:hypothetical protein [Verrucomicrobiota bacterium]
MNLTAGGRGQVGSGKKNKLNQAFHFQPFAFRKSKHLGCKALEGMALKWVSGETGESKSALKTRGRKRGRFLDLDE